MPIGFVHFHPARRGFLPLAGFGFHFFTTALVCSILFLSARIVSTATDGVYSILFGEAVGEITAGREPIEFISVTNMMEASSWFDVLCNGWFLGRLVQIVSPHQKTQLFLLVEWIMDVSTITSRLVWGNLTRYPILNTVWAVLVEASSKKTCFVPRFTLFDSRSF